MFKERNVFITGGAGFAMSHVAERLATAGKRLVLFDNLDEHAMNDDMKALVARDNVRFVKGDIRDRAAVAAAMQGAEVVYHFAAVMGTSARFKLEVPTVEINVIGTLHVLDAALAAGVKYFVHPPRPALTKWLTPYIISKIAPDAVHGDVPPHVRAAGDRPEYRQLLRPPRAVGIERRIGSGPRRARSLSPRR